MGTTAQDKLIVALDGQGEDILLWASELRGVVSWVKVGMTNFYAQGPSLIECLKAEGFRIFLDLKLHDIPHQVEGAAYQLAQLGVELVTVHASGGRAMIEAARRGLERGALEAQLTRPRLLAVTVLTSLGAHDLAEVGIERAPREQVLTLATLALEAGADGVVCSPQEAADVRAHVGPEALIVTPGVRPVWAATNDQQRVTTPADALSLGATHLVVGRPITHAVSKSEAASRVLAEMEEALHD